MKSFFYSVLTLSLLTSFVSATSWAIKEDHNLDCQEALVLTKTKQLEKVKAAFEKIIQFEKETSEVLLEREALMSRISATIALKENMLILGPPGTGKSKIKTVVLGNILNKDGNHSLFSRTLDRDTQRSEILGPLDVKELQENNQYVRLREQGMLHTLFAAFDEFFRARPGAYSYILEVFSDRVLSDGINVFKGNLEAAFALSNGTLHDIYTMFEIDPTLGGAEAPKAMFDRFLLAFYVLPLAHEDSRTNVDLSLTKDSDTIQKISIQNFYDVYDSLNLVEFPVVVHRAFGYITDQIRRKNKDTEIASLKEMAKNRSAYRYRTTKLLLDRSRVAATKYLKYHVLKEWALTGGKRSLSVNINDLKILTDVYGLDGATDDVLNQFMNDGSLSDSDKIQIQTVKTERNNVVSTVTDLAQKVQTKFTSTLKAEYMHSLAINSFSKYRLGEEDLTDLKIELLLLKGEETESGNQLSILKNKIYETIISKATQIVTAEIGMKLKGTLKSSLDQIEDGLVLSELKEFYLLVSSVLNENENLDNLSQEIDNLIEQNRMAIKNRKEQEEKEQRERLLAEKQALRLADREKLRFTSLLGQIKEAHKQFDPAFIKTIKSFKPIETTFHSPYFIKTPDNENIYYQVYNNGDARSPSLAAINSIAFTGLSDATTHASHDFHKAKNDTLKGVMTSTENSRMPNMISIDKNRMLAIHKNVGIIFDPLDLNKRIVHNFPIAKHLNILTSYDPESRSLFVLDLKNKNVLKYGLDHGDSIENPETISLLSNKGKEEPLEEILKTVIQQKNIHNNTLNSWSGYEDDVIKRSFFAVDGKTNKAWFSRPANNDIWSIDLDTGILKKDLTLEPQSVPVGFDQNSMTVFFAQFDKTSGDRDNRKYFAAKDSKYFIVPLRNQENLKGLNLNVNAQILSSFSHHWIVPNRFLVMPSTNLLNEQITIIYDVMNNEVVGEAEKGMLAKCVAGQLISPNLYVCLNRSAENPNTQNHVMVYELNFKIP